MLLICVNLFTLRTQIYREACHLVCIYSKYLMYYFKNGFFIETIYQCPRFKKIFGKNFIFNPFSLDSLVIIYLYFANKELLPKILIK